MSIFSRIAKGIATAGISELPGLLGIDKADINPSNRQIDEQYARSGLLNRQQDAFSEELRRRMLGRGPNPVLEQFKQNADQAALRGGAMIASTRGISPALAARLGATNMGAAHQATAGQAAVLGQQQMIDAAKAYQDQLAGVSGQNLQQQAILQQALASYNNAQVGATDSYNKSMSGIVGGAIGGAGAAMGKMSSGGVAGIDGEPVRSSLGQMLAAGGMSYGGSVGAGPGGGRVGGRAMVAGDSPQNDTVPALLSPGEVVIPRSLADDPDGAADFVRALQRRSGVSRGFERVARLGLTGQGA